VKPAGKKEKPVGLLLSVVGFNELNARIIGFSCEKESLKV